MRHNTKHIKHSGDVHPPEVEDELRISQEDLPQAGGGAAAAPQGSGPAQSSALPQVRSIVVSMPARQYVDAARDQVRARPLIAAAAAFFAGFAVAVVSRSR